jgi:hypothetical protein
MEAQVARDHENFPFTAIRVAPYQRQVRDLPNNPCVLGD